MRTTLQIPEALIFQAKKISGVTTKTQAVILALTEFVQKRKSQDLLKLKGSLKAAFDYKVLRRKR